MMALVTGKLLKADKDEYDERKEDGERKEDDDGKG